MSIEGEAWCKHILEKMHEHNVELVRQNQKIMGIALGIFVFVNIVLTAVNLLLANK